MTGRCPRGHLTSATDFCETCGSAVVRQPASTRLSENRVMGRRAARQQEQAPQEPQAPQTPRSPHPQQRTPPQTPGGLGRPVGQRHQPPSIGRPQPRPPQPQPQGRGPMRPPPPGRPGGPPPQVEEVLPSLGPAPSAPAPAEQTMIVPVHAHPQQELTWVADLSVDPEWYAVQQSDESCPAGGHIATVSLQAEEILIGRHSATRGITPDLDCVGDHGASRQHARLIGEGGRWWVEDLESANGTFVRFPGAPMPTVPIPPGRPVELGPGAVVFVGAWTRIEVRPADAGAAVPPPPERPRPERQPMQQPRQQPMQQAPAQQASVQYPPEMPSSALRPARSLRPQAPVHPPEPRPGPLRPARGPGAAAPFPQAPAPAPFPVPSPPAGAADPVPWVAPPEDVPPWKADPDDSWDIWSDGDDDRFSRRRGFRSGQDGDHGRAAGA